MDERVVVDIRVAAAIQFKIGVKRTWKESRDRVDKQFVRENIIPSLCAAPPKKPEMMRIVVEKMVQIYTLPIPESLYPDKAQRPHQHWWKCKKIASHFLYHIYKSYGLPNPSQPEFKEFSLFWMNSIANNLINTILAELHKVCAGRKMTDTTTPQASPDSTSTASALAESVAPEFVSNSNSSVYMSPVVMFYSIQILGLGLLHNATYAVTLKPHLPLLLNEIIIPNAGLTKEEAEMFDDDPIEFLNYIRCPSTNDLTSRAASLGFFRRLCGNRKQTALAGFLDMFQKHMAKAFEIVSQAIAAGRVPSQFPTDSVPNPTASSQAIWHPLQVCLHLLAQISTVVFLPSESAFGSFTQTNASQTQSPPSMQQIISPYDSMIMSLISTYVLPLMSSSFPFPILRREAALFIASYAPMISVSPAATASPSPSPSSASASASSSSSGTSGSSSTPLLVALIGATVSLLDDPSVPVCVAASECITNLLSFVYTAARPSLSNQTHSSLAEPSPFSIASLLSTPTGSTSVISTQLLGMVESFLPVLFEKLFNNLQRAGQAADRVIISINRAVKVAGERMEPYATSVFTRIVDMMKALLTERWGVIDKGLALLSKREAEKKAAKSQESPYLPTRSTLSSSSGANGADDFDDEDDEDAPGSNKDFDSKILKAAFGDPDEEGLKIMHRSELAVLSEALYNILHFTSKTRVSAADPNGPLLFSQFEPVISDLLVKGLEHRDVEFIDMFVSCFQLVCLVLLDFTPDKSTAGAAGMSSAGGASSAAGASQVGSSNGVSSTMAAAFTMLCQWMEVNDDLMNTIIPTIQAFAQNNIEVIFNTPAISEPLFNSIRNAFGLKTGSSKAAESSPFAPSSLGVLGGTPLSYPPMNVPPNVLAPAAPGEGGDDDEDDEQAHLDSAILSSVRLLKFLLIRCGIKRLNSSVGAEAASSTAASTGASISTSPFYTGIIQSPALVSTLFAMLWKRYDECKMDITKARVAHSIVLLFFASPFCAFNAMRKQTIDTQTAIHSVQLPQITITAKNAADAERSAKMQKKKLRKAQKEAVKRLKLPTIPTISEFIDWVEAERSEFTDTVMDKEVVLFSLLSLLSIPIEWYPEEYGIREQTIHSSLPKLYQSIATIKQELDKDVIEEQKREAEKGGAKGESDAFESRVTIGMKNWTEGMLRMLNDDQNAYEDELDEDVEDTSVAKVLARLKRRICPSSGDAEEDQYDEDDDDDVETYLLNEMIQIDESHEPAVIDADFETKMRLDRGREVEVPLNDSGDDEDDDSDFDLDDDLDEIDNIFAAEIDDDDDDFDEEQCDIDQPRYDDEDCLDTFPLKGMSLTAVASESIKYFSLMDKEGTFNKVIIQLMPFTQQTIKVMIGL
ncbi:uncharacterized protein MONOS_10124 [Monocercomonoides exilis]|uniref:uncharacterized protein n=1 Tax=Monocercomonoides exilis TaxID=2049356 RepID=UPI00355A1C65|nr:hypothetical protein MONOS_10124 [Monocercomonoides exilis]|eukprot:MONOS_10124.1-p1 / transcript=MONOS_10124.1 / gene=MONOS_10124 / organism=Monocercomonoides_exilis_PA203 / gene_product=unspecified product / transcript_product=unspecified product / location=Mono_scaffold00446:26168-30798(+) / protein_length=1368 / sequence_SO=supercontig / SO=protein_coding / is_pseudo=false